jgi:RNA polymerase sigma-70 factor (ECF subfamily)
MEEQSPSAAREKSLEEKAAAVSAQEEAGLVERVKAGEMDLFLRLIQPHERTLACVCHSILQNEADAQEVVQETFLKALSHIGQLKAGSCFREWLLQIAVNEARQRLRKRRLYSPELAPGEEPDAEGAPFKPKEFSPWRETPLLEVERKELREALSRALASLDGIYREVLVMRDVEHFTTEQTSIILGISPACVMTRLHRARLQMREQLAPFLAQPRSGWIPMRVAVDQMRKHMRWIMRCDRLLDQLLEYIDGGLDPERRAKIEAHLKLCDTCSVLVDTTRHLLYIVGNEEVLLPPLRYRRLPTNLPLQPESDG